MCRETHPEDIRNCPTYYNGCNCEDVRISEYKCLTNIMENFFLSPPLTDEGK